MEEFHVEIDNLQIGINVVDEAYYITGNTTPFLTEYLLIKQ